MTEERLKEIEGRLLSRSMTKRFCIQRPEAAYDIFRELIGEVRRLKEALMDAGIKGVTHTMLYRALRRKVLERLQYLALDPKLLHPENNSQWAAAQNFLTELKEEFPELEP